MSNIAIRVENLSKMYRIGTRDEQPRGLVQAARSLVASPFAYLQRMRRPPTEEETLWALRDVSFEVKHGEVLGIIGRNGAGKSTLLKILSRITEPSSGEAQVFGRVGSLLEVGTGFHPELTGRENIYLNGAILGMKRSEIDRKFDEIVDFSGVERFLDTPVKRYSSGMYVRLAFAVAAHLDPEILVIDEVLAVGDVDFQKKCLGKMDEIAGQGRTVLFVSHNLAAIQNLCPAAILMEHGKVALIGDSRACIDQYVDTVDRISMQPFAERADRQGNGRVKIVNFHMMPGLVYSGNECTFHVELETDVEVSIDLGIGINSLQGQPLLLFFTGHTNCQLFVRPGRQNIQCVVSNLPLAPGYYRINICVQKGDEIFDWIKESARIEILPSDFYGSGRLPAYGQAPLLLHHSWLS